MAEKEKFQKTYAEAVIIGLSTLNAVANYPKLKSGLKEIKNDIKKVIKKS